MLQSAALTCLGEHENGEKQNQSTSPKKFQAFFSLFMWNSTRKDPALVVDVFPKNKHTQYSSVRVRDSDDSAHLMTNTLNLSTKLVEK